MQIPRTARPAAALSLTAAVVLALAACSTADEPAPDEAAGRKLFDAQVSGLLKQNCVKCHGGDKTEGEFDLTSRDSLLRGGEHGAAIVAGNAQGSLLFRLVNHAEEPHMPDEADKLPETAIAAIGRWIDAGAPYSNSLVETSGLPVGKRVITAADHEFWSFRPLASPQPPACRNESWCRTPIDRFIEHRLEAAGIAPNDECGRRQWIRRASFDLIGLPPKPEEVAAFLADTAPDAYDKVIDRLLASPHYGERWGRHWLDLARFAESHGYEHDYDRPFAFHYRDFVIRALNADMPFDQFAQWQIAGDEIEPDNPLALMATGFLGAGMHATQITANQVEKERYDELDDMAATVGTAMLGLTVGCARCHDHKFDPIPQADYYRLISTFTTTVRCEVDVDLDVEATRQRREQFEREHAPYADALTRYEREQLAPGFAAWLAAGGQLPTPRWLVLESQSLKSEAGATFTPQSDGSYLAGGNNGRRDQYTFVTTTNLTGITAIRLDALADPSMVKGGPGRADNGNFALSDLRLTVTAPDGQPEPVKFAAAQATFEQLPDLKVANVIDDNKTSAWAVDPQFGRDQSAVFELDTPIGDAAGRTLTFTLSFANNTGHNIGRLRLAATTDPRPVPLDGELGPLVLSAARRALATPADKRTDADQAALRAAYATTDPQWRELAQAEREHARQAPQPNLAKVMVTTEGLPPIRNHSQGADFLEKTYYLKRGDLAQKVAEAPPGFLQVLSTSPDGEKHWQQTPPANWRTSYRRRSLAGWITDPQQGAGHLLARVIVNRLWQHHIGRGIVATPSDFGARRTAYASGAARLAGRRIDSRRLAAQTDPQADHAERRLPRKPRLRRAPRRGRPRQQALLAPPAHPARGRSPAQRALGGQRHPGRNHVRLGHTRRIAAPPEHLFHRQAQSTNAADGAVRCSRTALGRRRPALDDRGSASSGLDEQRPRARIFPGAGQSDRRGLERSGRPRAQRLCPSPAPRARRRRTGRQPGVLAGPGGVVHRAGQTRRRAIGPGRFLPGPADLERVRLRGITHNPPGRKCPVANDRAEPVRSVRR